MDSHDVPYFKKFRDDVEPYVRKLKDNPRFSIAFQYFVLSQDMDRVAQQLVNLFVCLESLFSREPSDVTGRLANRIANLLGKDAAEIEKLKKEVRDFYDIRCKIVRGDILEGKHCDRIQNISRLRELTSRCVLAGLVLAGEVGFRLDYYEALDRPNNELKSSVQRKAASLLHIGTV